MYFWTLHTCKRIYTVQDSYDLSSFASMIGSDESTTNYPGKIPPGLDLPSDAVDEKKLEKWGSDSGFT